MLYLKVLAAANGYVVEVVDYTAPRKGEYQLAASYIAADAAGVRNILEACMAEALERLAAPPATVARPKAGAP